ncbi:hypothetical protein RHGRI_035883 [Rhododendron griersonianum]|uniref:C2H2-type domain-containing protein n=1 Tax=Rhododendron griersonianum TaxID=479676 RepID=A0AAV6HPY8_9ERIC|nr:hypothetical protein RHGRI_035883 [Rhododendron griersonianum]
MYAYGHWVAQVDDHLHQITNLETLYCRASVRVLSETCLPVVNEADTISVTRLPKFSPQRSDRYCVCFVNHEKTCLTQDSNTSSTIQCLKICYMMEMVINLGNPMAELFYDENDEAVKSRQIHYDDSAIDRLLDCEQIGDKAANMDEAEEDGFLKAFKAVKSRQIHYDDVAIDRLLDREQIGDKGANLDEAEEDGFFKAFKMSWSFFSLMLLYLSYVAILVHLLISKHLYGAIGTPLWRNGSPEKPILCNACGPWWRTKGTFVNHTPFHARAEPDEFEDYKFSKTNSDSCVLFGSAYASDLTDPAHSVVWDTMRWSSHISASYEEDFLFESYASMVSFEIGPGSILIRYPSSIAREQESEANSLSVENERHPPNEATHIWPPFLLIFL